MRDEKTIVIDINLTRGLVALLALALLMAALVGYLTWGQREAAASGSQAPLATSAGLRGYYLTQSQYNGAQADGTDGNGAGVCAEGYHFASLWEILDPSNLKYNTDLGMVEDDSGQGPPTMYQGWVRTGYNSDSSSTTGEGNCNAWTSSDSGHYGTRARLPPTWTAGQDIHVWQVDISTCAIGRRVWCVED
jgi:hypothetical protein